MISTGALRSIYAVLPMAVVPLAFADPLILMQAILVLVGSVTALPAPVAVPIDSPLVPATRRDSSRRNRSARRRMVAEFRC